ncbi:hypothetical protein ACSDQ9_05830 [Aestuariimicrobium soli]|uniref:hypothetical protein n=1 Tax=Aestuariimicrobium soli TaxID=2035834 RepID=UPI003EBB9455
METDLILSAALGSRRQQADAAEVLGWSVPRLHQVALKLAADPQVAATHPVECRRILDRRDRGRAARRGV